MKGYVVTAESALLHRASILSREAGYHRTQGRHELGLRHVDEALAIREKILGLDHTLAIEGLDSLSIFYLDQGRYKEAEALCVRALGGLEKTLDPDHLTTLETVNHLGTLSVRLENFERAEASTYRAAEDTGPRSRVDPRDIP